MVKNSPSGVRLCHGLHWHGEQPYFIHCEWDEYNEGILAYRLFGLEYKPVCTRLDLPLFVYYYPMCYLDKSELTGHLRAAYRYQKEQFGHAGITSCDTEYGYTFFNSEVVSPLAMLAIKGLVPEAGAEYERLGVGCVHAYNVRTGWKSSDRVGIDEGAALLLSVSE
jgi:hypothetical protein